MNEKENLENRIMNNIKSGKVRLKSKYIFLAKRLSLGSGLILTILLATLFFNLALFYMKETENLAYLTFGFNGFFAFLESFPYVLVISLIMLIFLAGFLTTKTDFSYKKSFGEWSIYLMIVIIFLGTALTFTNINNEFQKHKMFMSPFFEHRLPSFRGIAGPIVSIQGEEIIINTREGLEYVDLKNIKNIPILKENDFVLIIGERSKKGFLAKEIKIEEDKNKMFLIRDNTKPKSFNKNCVDNCLIEKFSIEDCFLKCENLMK